MNRAKEMAERDLRYGRRTETELEGAVFDTNQSGSASGLSVRRVAFKQGRLTEADPDSESLNIPTSDDLDKSVSQLEASLEGLKYNQTASISALREGITGLYNYSVTLNTTMTGILATIDSIIARLDALETQVIALSAYTPPDPVDPPAPPDPPPEPPPDPDPYY